MDHSFRPPEVFHLRQHSGAEYAGGSSPNGSYILPALPMHLDGLHHFRLIHYLSQFPSESLLKVTSLFPHPQDEPADKYQQGGLDLAIFIVFGIISSPHEGRVKAVRQNLPAQAFFPPVCPLVEQEHLCVRSHQPSLAKQLAVIRQQWEEVYFVGLRWRAGHDEIVAFVYFVVAVCNPTDILSLLDFPDEDVELDTSLFGSDEVSKILAHMLRAQFGCFLLQSILGINNILEAFVLMYPPQQIEEANFCQLVSQCSLESQLQYGLHIFIPHIVVQPGLS